MTEKVTSLGAGHRPANRDLVGFGDLVVNREVQIRKRGAHALDHRLEILHTAGDDRRIAKMKSEASSVFASEKLPSFRICAKY